MKPGLLCLTILIAMAASPVWSQNDNAGHEQAGIGNGVGRRVATVYSVPFASNGNTLELTVANGSNVVAQGVTVTPSEVPSWIHLSPGEGKLDQLLANNEMSVIFAFDVDKHAMPTREQKLTFNIRASTGEEWKKEITLKVGAPERFELLQNYPNPFNPTTKIEYIVPKDAHVKLAIFNTLGQEVVRLVDKNQEAGYQSIEWDASNLPSGVYYYRLDGVIGERADARFADIKKMLVVK